MIRTIFFALGVPLAAVLAFGAAFLGNLTYEIDGQTPANEKLAVSITRQLSRTWALKDLKPHYAKAVADKLDASAAQKSLDAFKPLGALLDVDDLTHRTCLTTQTLSELTSPAAAASILSELLSKTVTVTFVGKFAGARAQVTVKLRSEGGVMRLWHMQIDSLDPLDPAPPKKKRRRIRYA